VHPEGHPRCEIIRRMIQVAPDVTRLIDRLEKAGFAKRARSTEDRRLSLTLITTSGLRLLEKMQPEIESLDVTIRSRLSESDARTLSKLCEKIYTD
jgi:MarR family transcriptional regulator, 2-MHQ and catechol-resistance regulon repressor